MKHHTRRAIAFIIGQYFSSNSKNAVYDYTFSEHFLFSGEAAEGNVSVYDHTIGQHVGGTLSSLYHYGNGQHLSLNISGKNFTGFDFDESAHFSGNINGSSISIYDYGQSQYYNYSI